MPARPPADMWIAPFRRQVKLTTNDGWNMLDSRGKMRLQVREDGRPAQSVTLPYDWSEAGAALALPRIQQIFKRYVEGKLTLAKAAQGADTASSAQQLDWPHLFREYRQHRPQASEATWQGKYLPVLNRLADVMEGRRPRPGDGTELCMAALEHWEQGSRQRQIMRQNLGGFLRWAVERGHLKPCYLPPANLPEVRKPKRVGFALSDAQILRLLEGLPSGERHDRWRFAIQLCAVYGLRPEELRYLRIKDGPDGQELWTIYRKSKGGRSGDRTEPRRLHPLLVRDLDGTALDWNLQGRVAIGERLPPLGQPGKAGEALLTYLRRLEIWMALKADAAHQGEALVPYTFRHRYAKASHAGGLPIANIAAAMGHTVEVHLVSYARFAPDATADLYAQLNAGPRAELGAASAGQSVGVKKAVRTTRS